MGPTYSFFNHSTLPIFRAVAGCVVPSDDAGPGADTDACLQIADRALAGRPAKDQKLFGTFLRALQVLPVLRYGRTFTSLDAPRQAAVLRYFERNTLVPKLRAGLFGVKTFALLGYYGNEDNFGALHYPGPRTDAPYYQLGKGSQR